MKGRVLIIEKDFPSPGKSVLLLDLSGEGNGTVEWGRTTDLRCHKPAL